MFTDKLALQIADLATKAGIPPAGMVALVEVETSGKPTEEDGRTPTFLFERHKFYSELSARKPEKLKEAIRLGLAIPRWDREHQYRDQRTSSERLALLARAKSVDEDCALRACSWGLPQLMGSECAEVGFPSAAAMVSYLTTRGIPGHIELMIRFLKGRHLVSAIERKDWPYVALRYNGAGYRRNQYDTRLAAADRKWERKLPTIDHVGGVPAEPPPEASLTREEIKQIQIKLRELKYSEVGIPNGEWRSRTTGAISAFQSHEGLPVTGHYDAATRAALDEAVERPASDERAEATIQDLRDAGSTTIAAADAGSAAGYTKVGLGVATVAGTALEKGSGALDHAQDAVDKAGQVKSLWGSIHDLLLPVFGNPAVLLVGIALLILGVVVVYFSRKVKLSRLWDHQDGTHAGRVEL